jgi:hypothetical protein
MIQLSRRRPVSDTKVSRRAALAVFTTVASALLSRSGFGGTAHIPDELVNRFEYLSANGSSNCSPRFLAAIRAMPEGARLQGSCCGPMSLHHYAEQVLELRSYAGIPEIPPDPYDIEAGLAKRLLIAHNEALTPAQQAVYDEAFGKSAEGGPCCCRCWRWHVLGGMAKVLIRKRGFTADTIGTLWDLENGCGGDDHVH